MIDWITGDKFRAITKHIYAPPRGHNANRNREAINNFPASDYRHLANTLDKRNLKERDIIYTHTYYVDQLFEYLENVDKGLIIVTHNSDINIDFPPPDNIIKWFSQNVNIVHPKIHSLPIGLENDRWFPALRKKEKMFDKLQQPRNYRNLVYMNFNTDSGTMSYGPEKRKPVYELFKNTKWVTNQPGKNGAGFDSYIDNVFNHKFVLCPEGNGIDTHRIWETLYMGSIPIVKRCINTGFYWLLPICLVDEWSEVTEDFLNKTYDDFQAKRRNMSFGFNQLNFQYWGDKILYA